MKRFTFILLISVALSFLLGGCNPFLSKELRTKNRCNRKLERVVSKCPDLLRKDTIRVPFEVKVPEILIKDSIWIVVDTTKIDSLLGIIEGSTSREDKVRYITRFVESSFKLDTLIEDSLYSMRLTIVDGVLIPDIKIKERTVKGETTTDVDVVTPIKLTGWERFVNGAVEFWWVLVLFLLLLYAILRIRKLFK